MIIPLIRRNSRTQFHRCLCGGLLEGSDFEDICACLLFNFFFLFISIG
jgi:hypothetical protein